MRYCWSVVLPLTGVVHIRFNCRRLSCALVRVGALRKALQPVKRRLEHGVVHCRRRRRLLSAPADEGNAFLSV